MTTVDLFGGPGGLDVAARRLGLNPVGIEWDPAACATRRAAGLDTIQADVAAIVPRSLGIITGLLASAPCQPFSAAGDGLGRAAIDLYREAIAHMAAGEPWSRQQLDEACRDERAHLVLEPLRWALDTRPDWVVLEQVKEVLPLWEEIAHVLRRLGYSVWTGLVSAERYGVPQTRVRAILIASMSREVRMPMPTHQRFVAPRRRDDEGGGLFDLPEAQRVVVPEDAHLLPWVSMAEALGWGMTARPSMTVTGGGARTGGAEVFGNAARQGMEAEREAGRWLLTDTGSTRGGTRTEGRTRRGDEPAPTITGRADQLEMRPVAYDSRGQRDGRTGEPNRMRSVDEPAPTIAGESRNDSWVFERPATTVNCDPRISAPGHHASDVSGSQQAGAVRVTVQEAAILQSFPADYPWQGTKTKQFEQVGNAVPPDLAEAILREVIL